MDEGEEIRRYTLDKTSHPSVVVSGKYETVVSIGNGTTDANGNRVILDLLLTLEQAEELNQMLTARLTEHHEAQRVPIEISPLV